MKISLAYPGPEGTIEWVEAEAICFGDWAAHQCPYDAELDASERGEAWCVTHVPTGKRLRSCGDLILTRDQAVHAAVRLNIWEPDLSNRNQVDAVFGEVLDVDGIDYK